MATSSALLTLILPGLAWSQQTTATPSDQATQTDAAPTSPPPSGPSSPAAAAMARPLFRAPPGSAASETNPAPLTRPELSFHGITLYGVVDVGFAYQSHGAPLNGDFPPGLEYVISKNSNRSLGAFAPNALSQSKVGLRGKEAIDKDLSVVFQLETQFVPTSGRLANGPASIVKQNGVPLTQQTAYGDSSKAGQPFAGMAYGGLASQTFGTLTGGRHYSVFLDGVVAYDPLAASHAFSVVGYQGAAQGGASTEDARLDRSIRYTYRRWGAHVTGLYQFGKSGYDSVGSYQADVGYEIANASFDIAYAHVNDAVQGSPLSAVQLKTAPGDSIAATIADTNAYGVFARYKLSNYKFFSAWEHIEYSDPSHPLSAGVTTIGDIPLGVVNNTAYVHKRGIDYVWAGAKWAITPKLDLTGAFYHLNQNSYGATACTNTSKSTCSGDLNAGSAVLDRQLTRWIDAYAGVMYSTVDGGLASGYLHRSTVDPTLGLRVTF